MRDSVHIAVVRSFDKNTRMATVVVPALYGSKMLVAKPLIVGSRDLTVFADLNPGDEVAVFFDGGQERSAPYWFTGGVSRRTIEYTPTLGLWSIGAGSISGEYVLISDDLVSVRIKVVFGTGATFNGQPTLTLPFDVHAAWVGERSAVHSSLSDANGGSYSGRVSLGTSVGVGIGVPLVTQVVGAYVADQNLSATVPMAWTANDRIIVVGTYRRALPEN